MFWNEAADVIYFRLKTEPLRASPTAPIIDVDAFSVICDKSVISGNTPGYLPITDIVYFSYYFFLPLVSLTTRTPSGRCFNSSGITTVALAGIA